MSTTRTSTSDLSLGRRRPPDELPPLTATDRLALRLGLALLLWGQQRAERRARLDGAERAESSRRSRAADRAAHARDTAFEHRQHAGPTW
jgi:hypothetical protein